MGGWKNWVQFQCVQAHVVLDIVELLKDDIIQKFYFVKGIHIMMAI